MKKVLLVVALILFAGGLYVNFAMEPSTGEPELMNETGTSDEVTENDADGQDEDLEDDAENSEAGEEDVSDSDEAVEIDNEPEAEIAFNQDNLNTVYEEAVQNNEALIFDLLLPEYYSEDFVENLEDAFDTGTIQFNRLDLDANSTNLSELAINENSDAVIIDALQIQDYDDAVLLEREVEALTSAYTNIYNNDKTVFLLGNADVYQDEDEDENLAEALVEDETYFTDNDYYYIDNQDVEVDGDYYDDEEDVMTAEVESEIIENIHDYLISE